MLFVFTTTTDAITCEPADKCPMTSHVACQRPPLRVQYQQLDSVVPSDAEFSVSTCSLLTHTHTHRPSLTVLITYQSNRTATCNHVTWHVTWLHQS